MTFEYRCPVSLEEAVGMLYEYGAEGVAKMGGCTVVTGIRRGYLAPRAVVGLHKVPGLDALEYRGGELVIGARVSLAALERMPGLRHSHPLLARAVAVVASPVLRNVATLVGNLGSAQPDGYLAPVLALYDAVAEVTGANGSRTIAVAELARAPHKSQLSPGEVVTAVRVPASPADRVGAYARFTLREAFDRTVAGAAVLLEVKDGVCQGAKVALVGAGPLPARFAAVERALTGRRADAEAITAASAAAVQVADPASDVRASADYRRHMMGVVVRQALEEALAGGEGGVHHR